MDGVVITSNLLDICPCSAGMLNITACSETVEIIFLNISTGPRARAGASGSVTEYREELSSLIRDEDGCFGF